LNKDKYIEILRGDYTGGLGHVQQHHDRSQFVDNTTAPTSILEAGWSKFSAGNGQVVHPKT